MMMDFKTDSTWIGTVAVYHKYSIDEFDSDRAVVWGGCLVYADRSLIQKLTGWTEFGPWQADLPRRLQRLVAGDLVAVATRVKKARRRMRSRTLAHRSCALFP